MRSSLYVTESEPGHVVVDMSGSPQALFSPDTVTGFSLGKTIEHLGIEMTEEIVPDSRFSKMHLVGDIDTLKRNVDDLHRHIGLIARFGAQQRNAAAWDRDYLGRTLGHITDFMIPGLASDASFKQTMGRIVYLFADMTNDDGVAIFYDRIAPWRLDEAIRAGDFEQLRFKATAQWN